MDHESTADLNLHFTVDFKDKDGKHLATGHITRDEEKQQVSQTLSSNWGKGFG
jgi:hypothetical protein